MWQSSDAMGGGRTTKGSERQGEGGLQNQAAIWPTPQAADSERASLTMMRGNPTLLGQATWMTPTSSDSKPTNETDEAWAKKWADGEVIPTPHQRLRNQVQASRSGHQRPTTPKDGPESSQPTRRLNPLFVEWLMGLPTGWLICEPLETASFHRWLHTWLRRFSWS